MENIIEINHLNKSFGDVKAVNDLSFRVKTGELFAFLGVNGAGKSTTISIMCGQLAKLLDFENLLTRTVGKLSGGQRRRIDIARALIHRPEILILDEPTTGLDPQTRKLLWDVVRELRKTENMTVFLTTHYMEEAADADYVIILDSGKIAAEGTPLTLKNTYTGDFITLYNPTEEALETLGLPYEKIRDAVRIAVRDTAEATRLITKHPDIFTDYEITKGKMDDVFLAVKGKKLTGGVEK